jgi:hypothetical protein
MARPRLVTDAATTSRPYEVASAYSDGPTMRSPSSPQSAQADFVAAGLRGAVSTARHIRDDDPTLRAAA